GVEGARDDGREPLRSLARAQNVVVASRHLREERDEVLGRERRASGEALVEDRPERADVARRARRLGVARLLGRGIARRAAERSLLREREAPTARLSRLVEVLREPQVG